MKVKTLLVLISVALVLVFVFIWLFTRPGHVRCSDFSTRDEMLKAFQRGAHYLDRDKDGKPCENIKY